jgi:NAD(P)-dependent dehydrogenase (short-subunit alcohol dehydrogenase family)
VTDRVEIVTGAFGSLGRVVARVAAERGWRVAALDQAPTAPADISSGEGRIELLAGVDLMDPASAQKAVGSVVSRLGRLDALLNIAGGFRWTPVVESDAAVWDLMFRMNVQTAVNASRAAIPHLIASGAGRIVSVGAGAAERASVGMGPYTASKSGVHRFTESLAEELKAKGVTVNAVLPTIIDTPQNRADMPDADPAKWVQPAELAEVMLFLASEQASAVTGALVRVPGRV